MPVSPSHVPKEEQKFPPLPNEVYSVVIDDIEVDSKPDQFAKPDADGTVPLREQYKMKLRVYDPAEYNDRLILCWVSTTLRASTKSKRPGLASFLKVVTGKDWGVEDREKVTGDFMNTLIGSKLRVTTQIEKSKTGAEYAAVVGFMVAR
jgi:hypothetical protein